jgi:hypothetical protein
MKSGGPKSNGKKGRQQRAAGQQASAAGKNLEQQYQELLQLREKVSSLTKKSASGRPQPKQKKIAIEVARPRDYDGTLCSGNAEIFERLSHNKLLFKPKRSPAATAPGLEWPHRVLIFWQNRARGLVLLGCRFRVFTRCRMRSLISWTQTIKLPAKFLKLRTDFICQYRVDYFAESPKLVNRH